MAEELIGKVAGAGQSVSGLMRDKLDNLIERLPWIPYVVVRTIQNWPERFRRICLYCVDCKEYRNAAENYEAEWYCSFRGDMEVDWQDTCRAFRGKRRGQL